MKTEWLFRSRRTELSPDKKNKKRGRKEEMGIGGKRPACAKAWRLQGVAGNLVLSRWSGKCRVSSYVMSRGQSITGNLTPFKAI